MKNKMYTLYPRGNYLEKLTMQMCHSEHPNQFSVSVIYVYTDCMM